jgi:hypothetical protein
MSDNLVVQFVGFQAKEQVREYSFMVRETACEPRQFTLTIPNEAFISHRARYQDGPEICSLKLRRELVLDPNQPSKTCFIVSDAELDEYSNTRGHKLPRKFKFSPHKEEFDS